MINNKKIFLISLGVFIAAIFLLFFYITRPIKIGVILSTQSSLGYEQNSAVRFYRDEFPRLGLRPVEYLIYNPALKDEEISIAYKKLEKNGVSAIIGGALSSEGVVLAKEAKRTGIPTLAFTVASDLLSNKKDSFYKFFLSTKYLGKYGAEYLNQQGISRLVVFTDIPNKSFSESVAKNLQSYFQGEVLILPWDNRASIWMKYRSFKPEYTVMVLPAHSMIEVIKKSKRIFPNMRFITAPWDYEKLFSNYYSPMIEGVSSFTANPGESKKYKEFTLGFEKKYKVNAQFGSHYVFATLDLLYGVIKAVGTNRADINSYLSKPRSYDFAYGKIILNEFGDTFPEKIFIKQIKNNNIQITKEIKVNEYSISK